MRSLVWPSAKAILVITYATFLVVVVSLWLGSGGTAWAAEQAPPAWAYPVEPRAMPAVSENDHPAALSGSAAALSSKHLTDMYMATDWHPEEHPAMPGIVAHGRKPAVYACGYCHLPSGNGRPENASLAGLPAGYIVEQVANFKSDARASSVKARLPPHLMMEVAKAVTAAEISASADYFSHLKPKSYTQVVESSRVPVTKVSGVVLVKIGGHTTEPIGHRIIEVADDIKRFAARDSHTAYTAYVPVGSIARGQALVNTGGGKTLVCATCHGPQLKGIGLVPAIIGRSPSSIMRQLYDFQSGARTGVAGLRMKPVVTRLGPDDMLAIVAYLASRKNE